MGMVMEYNTVHDHGGQHSAWSWGITLCIVMEYNTGYGHGVPHCA